MDMLAWACVLALAVLIEKYWYHSPDSPHVKRSLKRWQWWDDAMREAKRQRKQVKNSKVWKDDDNA
jgi:hypothetical protein